MQVTKILLSLSCISLASGLAQIFNQSFDSFIKTHSLYINPSEYTQLAKVYYSEVDRINESNGKNPWVEEPGPLTLTNNKFGYNKKIARVHKPSFHKNWNWDEFADELLPTHVDWRNYPVMSPVKDQGRCGSCWAFASTAVIETHVAIASGKLFDLSPQQIAACAPNPDHCGGSGNCAGATAELAFEYVASSAGILEEFQYPYVSYYGIESNCAIPTQSGSTPKAKISGYVKLPENNAHALMYAVATKGPIAVSVDASTWSSYKSGIFNGCNQSNPDINHAVVLVGYGEDSGQKYWLVRNSWSASWGESGYIRLARFDNEDEICGTDITPQDGTACDGQTQPVKVCGTCGILYDSAYPIGSSA
jgi:cathepsin L